ncbi:hypothetical protein SAMN05421641_1369 [Paracoccus thiocyanatus]|uniref:Phytase-like domain-containing protein n=1 Tax=Paracoccus thiocyanatus TaxID=34006 RepID=A0A1N6ZLN9_9RHOB|nr:hypothetical protein [Paracoccus thiocyanatus]SIR27707.1 hypothetical protein SAMN05421641_1369 [Paracoccus thiocyanatus]
MKRALLLVVVLLGAVGAGFALSGPCGWAGRVAGGGGCVATFALRDLVVTGDTLATDAQGRLVVGGIDYRPGRRRDRLQAQMVVATLDPATGAEIARADLGMQGRPEQLRLSPDGTAMAVSCNALYTCDLPGGSQPRETRVMLFDRDGERHWSGGIAHRDAPPDADGRAFDLGFSPLGNLVFAHVAFDAASGQVVLTRQQPLPDPNARLPAGTEIRLGDTALALDLPGGFIPFLRLDSARSADGDRIAILARRFSGPGKVRAAIRIYDIASGRLLAAHDIARELAPAILWHPQRDAVIVALAGKPAASADSALRLYAAGAGE